AANGEWGFVDTTGKWVIDPQFEFVGNFADGLAPVTVGGRTGYIDQKGRFVVNPQYDLGDEFSEGYAMFSSGNKFGFIDRKGRVMAEATFLGASHFSEGLAPIKTVDGWGFIDRTGKMVISPQFDTAESFENGLARVTIGNYEAYIDKAGAYIGDPFKGRTIRPAHTVQEVWEGDVIGPSWKSHVKFILYREGAKIKGFYSSSEKVFSELGAFTDVAGDVNPDDSVRLISESGFIWKGRFLAPVVIAGTRPSGEEGEAPEFPFRLYFVRDATTDDLPAPLQPTSSDWEAFLAKFKEAIAQRDQASLSVMLGRTFYLQNARLRSVDDVFRQLNWQELAKAIATGEVSDRKSPLGRRQKFITDAHPCPNCVYQVSLAFSQDADGQWRWIGVTYPGD
ncbi:MAG: WG repeat-containing protein, partial [Bryobacteraceae bacterium]|nr:WG repeat-containing protein [Bryobacteraceae bacterium]